jgi:hypothetical protein
MGSIGEYLPHSEFRRVGGNIDAPENVRADGEHKALRAIGAIAVEQAKQLGPPA